KKHPLGEKRNHPGSKLRQGFWMVFRFGVNNWGLRFHLHPKHTSLLLETSVLLSKQPKNRMKSSYDFIY
ncbi:hypothetical protein, partial [Streptococcus pneumoniae]